jgi:hypothetical protein
VLAVKVNYKQKQATIGTAPGHDVPKAEILKALDSLSYRGEFIKK